MRKCATHCSPPHAKQVCRSRRQPLSLAGAATSIIVATKVLVRQTRVCRDKTRLLSRQKYACRDKRILSR